MPNDVFDASKAKQFAWKPATKHEDVQKLVEALPEGEAAPIHEESTKSPQEDEEKRRKAAEQIDFARERSDALADAVARTWAIPSREAQAAATRKVLKQAVRLSLYVVMMQDHPLESMRLWRLVLRHFEQLRGVCLRPELTMALHFTPVTTHLPEVVELLGEAAATGDGFLTMTLKEKAVELLKSRRFPELDARLIRVLEEGKTWNARILAADWLGSGACHAAVPALRHMLQKPHAGLRAAALEGLLAMRALTPEDVLWQLHDSLIHPLPFTYGSRRFELVHAYAQVLEEAVKAVPPDEGWKPLVEIAYGGGVHVDRERHGTSSSWALKTLAAGYPERALPHVDEMLCSNYTWERCHAVEAAAVLPSEQAKSRLMQAAKDSFHRVPNRARELYLERFGEVCPVPLTACVPMNMLAGPPSPAFESRLAALHGQAEDARKAMFIVLFEELKHLINAPTPIHWDTLSPDQRETLALMLSCLPDLYILKPPEGMPNSGDAWAKVLIKQFGQPVFDFWLERARPEAFWGTNFGMLNHLSSAVNAVPLNAEQRNRLRDLACEAFTSPTWPYSSGVLKALSRTGPPAELLDRIWQLAFETEPPWYRKGRAHHITMPAIDALMKMGPNEVLDKRIAEAGRAYYQARSFDKLFDVLHLGFGRKVPAAVEIAEQCIREADTDPSLIRMADTCMSYLQMEGRLNEDWAMAALDRPESLHFYLATTSFRKLTSPAYIEALFRGLESTARDGAAAAECATALLWMGKLDASDPRLAAILARAPLKAQVVLADSMLSRDAPLEPLRQVYAAALTGSDETLAKEALDDLYRMQPEGTYELLEELWEKGPSPCVRDFFIYWLKKPSKAALYWQHDEDNEEDEDDFDDDLEEDDGEWEE